MRTLITGGLVVDATGREPLHSGVVLMEDGRISAVGCAADFGQPGAGTEVLDARGCTVLPGLIDTHVHVMHEPQLLKLPRGGDALWGANYVQTAFQGGVTTIRD